MNPSASQGSPNGLLLPARGHSRGPRAPTASQGLTQVLAPSGAGKGLPTCGLESQGLRVGFDSFCLKGQDLQQVVRSHHIQTTLGARTWGSGVAQEQHIVGSHGVPLSVPLRKDKGLRDRSSHDSERVCETHRQGALPRNPDAALAWLRDPGKHRHRSALLSSSVKGGVWAHVCNTLSCPHMVSHTSFPCCYSSLGTGQKQDSAALPGCHTQSRAISPKLQPQGTLPARLLLCHHRAHHVPASCLQAVNPNKQGRWPGPAPRSYLRRV